MAIVLLDRTFLERMWIFVRAVFIIMLFAGSLLAIRLALLRFA